MSEIVNQKESLPMIQFIENFSTTLTKNEDDEDKVKTEENNTVYLKGLEITNQLREFSQQALKRHFDTIKEGSKEEISSFDDSDIKTFSSFSELTGINRKMQLKNLSKKDKNKKLKSENDKKYSELEALQYEEKALLDQIEGIKKQTFNFTNIALQTEEEFKNNTPEKLLEYKTDHELFLNRLKFELIERKKLQEKLQKLSKDRYQIILQNHNLKKDFNQLKTSVVTLNTALKPLKDTVAKHKLKK